MSRKQWAGDIALTAVLVMAGMLGTGPAGNDEPMSGRDTDVWAYVLVLAAMLPLVLRRRYPAQMLVASGAALVTYLMVGYHYGPIMLVIPVMTYTVGSLSPPRRSTVLIGAYALVVLIINVTRFGDLPGGWLGRSTAAAASMAAFVAPGVIGAALRIRTQSEAGVRVEQARRAVSEERLRMAQELHDSVGHGLAVIAMQAGVALYLLDRDAAASAGKPASVGQEKVRAALEAIRDTSRESLDGLRAELQILRAPENDEAPHRPGRSMAEAGVLIERIRAGGVEVRADIADLDELAGVSAAGSTALPPDVDVAAYRILQESLTNVLRHSGASRMYVWIRRDGDAILIDVTDNGVGAGTGTTGATGVPTPAAAAGTGIAGMRARAESLGGNLEAGPKPGGGFAVRARLPVAGRVRQAGVPGSTA